MILLSPDKVGQAFDEATGALTLTLEGRATLEWDGQYYQTDGTSVGYRADFTREAVLRRMRRSWSPIRISIAPARRFCFPRMQASPKQRSRATPKSTKRSPGLNTAVTPRSKTTLSPLSEPNAAWRPSSPPATRRHSRSACASYSTSAVNLRMPNNYRPTEATSPF
jgi:hypothetical protein